MDVNVEFRKLLLKISNMMLPEDLNGMKYYCRDVIPTRLREEVETGVDLFEKLEERGQLDTGNLSFLEGLLESACAGRTDMKQAFDNYKNTNTPHTHSNTLPTTVLEAEGEDLPSIFSFLTKNLGREYKMVLRRVGVPDPILDQIIEENPCNTQEVIYKALKHWSQSADCPSPSQEHIVRALQGENRNDLALKIARGGYKYNM